MCQDHNSGGKLQNWQLFWLNIFDMSKTTQSLHRMTHTGYILSTKFKTECTKKDQTKQQICDEFIYHVNRHGLYNQFKENLKPSVIQIAQQNMPHVKNIHYSPNAADLQFCK